MITLVQIPWCGFCLVQKKILNYANVKFKTRTIPSYDRSYIWKITKNRYYQVPVLVDGKNVIFETDEDSQIIAKYLDTKFNLGLFPRKFAGVQNLIWRHIEHEVEEICSKLNDVYYCEFVPKGERLIYLRDKERKYGKSCIEEWGLEQKALLMEMEKRLWYYEQMLSERDYLLDVKPVFIDFDLFGMLEMLLYSGHYELPKSHSKLVQWFDRMKETKFSPEK